MTPLQMQILLHYYACADDFRGGDFSAPAVREAMNQFREKGYLHSETPKSGRCYDLTTRGLVYVAALMDVPEPSPYWIVKYPNQSPAVPTAHSQ